MGNKLLVSLDLLFAIRNQIKLGEDPRVSISTVLKSVQEQTGTGCRPPFSVLVLIPWEFSAMGFGRKNHLGEESDGLKRRHS